MKMLGDYELFVQLCENRGIEPPAEILEAIKSGSSNGELRLPCLSIVVPICGVLARTLSSSSTIRSVDLSDCMLLSKGLGSILDALCDGSSVTSLSLKGNNINGPAVVQLGNIFLHNNTLKRLSVEWNSLGTDPEAFAKFCDGLALNHNIEELDLRYNQISPHCAESLAKALKANKSLRTLDLSWNTLGLRGGETLLKGIQENHSLARLNLRGNCIPKEIVDTIDDFVQRNCRVNAISQKQISESVEIARATTTMAKERLEIAPSSATIDANLLINEPPKLRLNQSAPDENREIDAPLVDSMSTTKIVQSSGGDNDTRDKDHHRVDVVHTKIAELSSMLQDRTAAIDLLTREAAVREEEADEARTLIAKLRDEINRLREERENFELEKSRELEETREILRTKEEQWDRERRKFEASLRDSSLREKELASRAQRFEREIRKSSVEIATLKENSISQTQNYEDAIAKCRTELHRARREARERDNRHKIELTVLKNTLKESTEALEECQTQLQRSRGELRETGENLSSVKTRLVEVERVNCRLVRIEESFQRLKDEKKSLEEKSLDAQRAIATLQRQVATLQGELIEPQRRYGLVKDELEQEREKSARLRQELAEERARLQEQNAQLQTLNAQITALNNQINEIQNNHAETLRERDKERRILKEMISNKERDFNELKTEEVQRASQLYAAFSKYLGSIGPSATL